MLITSHRFCFLANFNEMGQKPLINTVSWAKQLSQYAEVVLCAWISKQAVVAACNMAGLFSACFLVAVTQHAGSSHVIIGGKWKPMATNASQGLNHVHFAKAKDSAGGRSSCQWHLCRHLRDFFILLCSLLHFSVLIVALCEFTGKAESVCDDLSLIGGYLAFQEVQQRIF